jgi:uncharacterized protein (DUF1015 family)
MADIIPFKGTRYNLEKIKDLSKVVAPPYDVISEKEQGLLYKRDKHNIIRILLGKGLASDNENDNKYIRARKYLKAWQQKGIFKKDTNPGIYINLQEFKLDGITKRRVGFIALLKLEDFDTRKSSVYPHENTISAPKEDRTKLIQTIEANLGPVFAIFEDKDRAISRIIKNQMNSRPLVDISDNYGARNKLWRISDKKIIARLCGFMRTKKIFIADGHHRYEAALQFSKLKKDPKHGYILTYLTDLLDEGLVVLPYHRLIGGVGEGLKPSPTDLKKHFTVKGLMSKKDAGLFLRGAKPNEARFVIYMQKRFTGLIFKNKKDLDVNIAQNLIIDPLKNFFIDFTKDLDYAVGAINDRPLQYDLAILMNPVKITEIRDVALSGNRMPQKSTYFYPKVLTGLVINVF